MRSKVRNKNTLLLLTSLLILCFISCRRTTGAGANTDPSELLPEDNDISGFTKNGSPAVMTDYQTIMDAVDGAAEKYIDFGFIEGVQQNYSSSSTVVDVQIFNQGTNENAYDIFREFYPSSPEVLSDNDTKVVIDHSMLIGYSLYYCRNNVFMQIHTGQKNNFALNMAKQFFWNIDRKISLEE